MSKAVVSAALVIWIRCFIFFFLRFFTHLSHLDPVFLFFSSFFYTAPFTRMPPLSRGSAVSMCKVEAQRGKGQLCVCVCVRMYICRWGGGRERDRGGRERLGGERKRDGGCRQCGCGCRRE